MRDGGSASTDTAPALCTEDPVCEEDPTLFGQNMGNIDSGVVGVARDGHLVYGLYNLDGVLWSDSELDICNGIFLDDGSYAYVTTATHPSAVGCWGPTFNVSD